MQGNDRETAQVERGQVGVTDRSRWQGGKDARFADMGMRLMGVLLFMPINSMAAPVALAVAGPSIA